MFRDQKGLHYSDDDRFRDVVRDVVEDESVKSWKDTLANLWEVAKKYGKWARKRAQLLDQSDRKLFGLIEYINEEGRDYDYDDIDLVLSALEHPELPIRINRRKTRKKSNPCGACQNPKTSCSDCASKRKSNPVHSYKGVRYHAGGGVYKAWMPYGTEVFDSHRGGLTGMQSFLDAYTDAYKVNPGWFKAHPKVTSAYLRRAYAIMHDSTYRRLTLDQALSLLQEPLRHDRKGALYSDNISPSYIGYKVARSIPVEVEAEFASRMIKRKARPNPRQRNLQAWIDGWEKVKRAKKQRFYKARDYLDSVPVDLLGSATPDQKAELYLLLQEFLQFNDVGEWTLGEGYVKLRSVRPNPGQWPSDFQTIIRPMP